MSISATERQLNLLFVLLNATRPIEREEIRKRVPGYGDKGDAAFERQFERDKEALRSLNIPVVTEHIDVLHEDAFGYYIDKNEWLLPEIDLTFAERTVLVAAAHAWRDAQIRPALAGVASVLTDREVADEISIDINLNRASHHIAACLQARSEGKCVEFNYLTSTNNVAEARIVAPWRIFMRDNQGYLIGFDQNRGEQRTFKLSRIASDVKVSNEEILESAPKDFDVEKIIQTWKEFENLTDSITLEILPGRAGAIRQLSTDIEIGQDFDVIRIAQIRTDEIIQLIAANCADVRILEPANLKTEVHSYLTGGQK